jgi:hypothetical protein
MLWSLAGWVKPGLLLLLGRVGGRVGLSQRRAKQRREAIHCHDPVPALGPAIESGSSSLTAQTDSDSQQLCNVLRRRPIGRVKDANRGRQTGTRITCHLGRGGWRLEAFVGSPVAGESALADSFVGVGVLTRSSQPVAPGTLPLLGLLVGSEGRSWNSVISVDGRHRVPGTACRRSQVGGCHRNCVSFAISERLLSNSRAAVDVRTQVVHARRTRGGSRGQNSSCLAHTWQSS